MPKKPKAPPAYLLYLKGEAAPIAGDTVRALAQQLAARKTTALGMTRILNIKKNMAGTDESPDYADALPTVYGNFKLYYDVCTLEIPRAK